jgi:hypothetical protein
MRKLFLLVISILVVCLFSSVVPLHSQQQKPEVYNEVATPVIEDELTPQQREHSKLYETNNERNEKIRDVLIRQSEFVSFHISCFSFSLKPLPPLEVELTEKADAVVIVTFVSKSSQITTNGKNIFTDYELRIEEALKDGRTGTLKPETTITVTRHGGKVLLFGKIARISLSAFKPLEPGRRYLLFLSYLPSTGAYQAVDANSSFDITDTRVENLNEGITRGFERDLAPFITNVRQAVASDQKKGGAQ